LQITVLIGPARRAVVGQGYRWNRPLGDATANVIASKLSERSHSEPLTGQLKCNTLSRQLPADQQSSGQHLDSLLYTVSCSTNWCRSRRIGVRVRHRISRSQRVGLLRSAHSGPSFSPRLASCTRKSRWQPPSQPCHHMRAAGSKKLGCPTRVGP